MLLLSKWYKVILVCLKKEFVSMYLIYEANCD